MSGQFPPQKLSVAILSRSNIRLTGLINELGIRDEETTIADDDRKTCSENEGRLAREHGSQGRMMTGLEEGKH